MRVKETVVYRLAELSGSAREKALDKCRFVEVEGYDWSECVVDDAKAVGAILGITVKDVWFSVGGGGGDGACYAGQYEYAPGAAKAIREHALADEELHRIADRLQRAQRRCFYELWAVVRPVGRDHFLGVDVHWDGGTPPETAVDEITEALRDFAGWIYGRVNAEYEYLTSDEAVADWIEANELEFTEDGRIA